VAAESDLDSSEADGEIDFSAYQTAEAAGQAAVRHLEETYRYVSENPTEDDLKEERLEAEKGWQAYHRNLVADERKREKSERAREKRRRGATASAAAAAASPPAALGAFVPPPGLEGEKLQEYVLDVSNFPSAEEARHAASEWWLSGEQASDTDAEQVLQDEAEEFAENQGDAWEIYHEDMIASAAKQVAAASEAEAAANAADKDEYGKLTVEAMKGVLRKLGLHVTGTKPVLLARLREYAVNSAAAPATGDSRDAAAAPATGDSRDAAAAPATPKPAGKRGRHHGAADGKEEDSSDDSDDTDAGFDGGRKNNKSSKKKRGNKKSRR